MTPLRPILGFDTSGAHCAAALYWPDGARAPITMAEDMAKGQAERLLPMITQMLGQAGLGLGDIGALAVGVGPGNFTGIRISVALARGLALGLGVPAIGVTGFDARALGVDLPDFWVTIPAPRGQVYVQRFGETAGQSSAPQLCDIPPLDAPILDITHLSPPDLALAIARRAAVRLAAGHAQPRPAPFYLRAADAAPPSDPPPVILS
ncbi:MAG: tRNA (adenosine(37)-N6)-threonylcarbamoyltransferase complex dimerization subunit type 1 TsaB [Cypionkella sp.]